MTGFKENLGENIASIRGNICEIFSQSQVIGSFICGSMLVRENPTCDIDIFVCCEADVTEGQRHEFTEYYLDLHHDFGKNPDVVSPGEVMSAASLQFGLNRILNMQPNTEIRNRYDFDYLCWAGMIDSLRLDIHVSDEFAIFDRLAHDGIVRWSEALLNGRYITHKTGSPTDADKILAGTVSCRGYYDVHR